LINQGDLDVIQDRDNEFARVNDVFIRIRGRAMSREEFRKNIVGVSWLRMLEILTDNSPEAVAAQKAQEVGQVALRDKWDQQIYGLQAEVKRLNSVVEDQKAWKIMGEDYLKQLEEARKQLADKGTELPPGIYRVV
jgi:hypothetical protein